MKNSNIQKQRCCEIKGRKEEKCVWSGVVYGLTPHIGCIAFIVFSVLGVTTATALFKPLLLNPYFFYILIVLSLAFATISAFLYLRKHGVFVYNKSKDGNSLNLSLGGVRSKWKYLATLYGATILTNLLLFMIIFPLVTNIGSSSPIASFSVNQSSITLQVDIPCSGHALLITDELRKTGVNSVKFRFPNLFDVSYDPTKISKEQILLMEVFKTYKATIIDESKQLNNTQLTDNSVINKRCGGCGSCGGGNCGCGN